MDTIPTDRQRGAQRWARFVSWAFAIAPILWGVVFYSFILHWHSFYGSWPDVHTKRRVIALQLASHESLAGGFAIFLIFSFPVWAVFVGFARHYVLCDLKRIGLFFIPWVLTFILVVLDLGGFIGWFFD